MDPDILSVLILFLLGLIIGSFLNVVVYRYNTGKGLGGRSHCTSCGHALRFYELIPFLSYLIQAGNCRVCAARISPRYILVEVITGVVFALSLLVATDLVSLFLLLSIFCVLIVIVVYDLRHLIIPDGLVLLLFLLSLVSISWDGGSFYIPTTGALVGGLGASFFFAFLWLISRGRWMGLGDAKLAFPLGLLVGYPAFLSLVVLSFWIGVIGVGVLVLFKRCMKGGQVRLRFPYSTLRMKDEIPFAPFLVVSFVLVYLFAVDVFVLTESVLLFLYPV